LLVNLSIPDEIKMMLPAFMVKTHSPAMELYEIKAISDEEIQLANKSFLEQGLPYAVVRESEMYAEAAA